MNFINFIEVLKLGVIKNMNNTKISEIINANVILAYWKRIKNKPWFWCIVAGIISIAAIGIYFIFFNGIKPKYDKNGEPIFVELSNEVYFNADDFLGYHVSVRGIVFQVLGTNKNTKNIYVWLAPEENEQNVIIECPANVDVNSGDYISCEGYIKSVSKFKNDFDTVIITPILQSTSIKKITYMEAMRPTLKTVELNNALREQYGYSISVNKVEFSEYETRVYITVKNNGKADFIVYEDLAAIVQNGKQYDTQYNRDADYEEIAYEIIVGASSSGVITFPAIEQSDFQFIIEGYTPIYEEDLNKYIFNISVNKTDNQSALSIEECQVYTNKKFPITLKHSNKTIIIDSIEYEFWETEESENTCYISIMFNITSYYNVQDFPFEFSLIGENTYTIKTYKIEEGVNAYKNDINSISFFTAYEDADILPIDNYELVFKT